MRKYLPWPSLTIIGIIVLIAAQAFAAEGTATAKVVAQDYATSLATYSTIILTISTADNTTITIGADGKITKGAGFTTKDKDSLKFWEALTKASPSITENIAKEYLRTHPEMCKK